MSVTDACLKIEKILSRKPQSGPSGMSGFVLKNYSYSVTGGCGGTYGFLNRRFSLTPKGCA